MYSISIFEVVYLTGWCGGTLHCFYSSALFCAVLNKTITTPLLSFRRNRWAKCAPLFQDVMR